MPSTTPPYSPNDYKNSAIPNVYFRTPKSLPRYWGKLRTLQANSAPFQIASGTLTGNSSVVSATPNNPDVVIAVITGTWSISSGIDFDMSPDGTTWTTVLTVTTNGTYVIPFCPGYFGYRLRPHAGAGYVSGTATIVIKQNADVKLACAGDSITTGVCGILTSQGADTSSGCQPYAWPTRLAQLFNGVTAPTAQQSSATVTSIIPTTLSSIFGDNGIFQGGGAIESYDARVTRGSGWASVGGIYTLNGVPLLNISNTTGVLSFAPAESFNAFHFTFCNFANGLMGKLQIKVDGSASGFQAYYKGTPLTNNIIDGTSSGPWASGTGGVIKITCIPTVSSPLADTTHTISLTPTVNGSYGPSYASIDCFSTLRSQLRIWNWGQSGSGIVDQLSADGWNGQGPAQAYFPLGPAGTISTVYIPDCTIFCLDINNANNDGANSGAAPWNISSYKTNYQQMITEALTTGDVVIMSGSCPNPAVVVPVSATIDTYVSTEYSLAKNNGLMFLDLHNRLVSWSNAIYIAQIMAGNLHMTRSGYWEIALFVFENLKVP